MYIRSRLTYANITATLALFIALGGGAYAATVLPANSVGPRQLKKNAVERSKIKNSAVDSAKVRNESLTGLDVNEGSLAKVAAAAAADNAAHAVSSAALDRISYKSVAGSVPENLGTGATATCDAGQRAIGGGVRVDDPANTYVVDAFPDGSGAFTARVGNGPGAARGFTVYAICTAATTVG